MSIDPFTNIENCFPMREAPLRTRVCVTLHDRASEDVGIEPVQQHDRAKDLAALAIAELGTS
ncbi:hypothetical protein X731_30035 [Mesorhizobium sp. L2C054A000]|nr:hypothetical protein X731_30035 [Mesorhizobium sp. L2C054A000]